VNSVRLSSLTHTARWEISDKSPGGCEILDKSPGGRGLLDKSPGG